MATKRKTNYQICDHPALLVKDGICHLCEQFDGQTDALSEVEE